jgi:hypothetical protein
MAYMPKIGDRVPVQLPDELVQGVVREVKDNADLVIIIERPPFVAKTYKPNVPYVARKLEGLLAGNRWEVLT